MIRTGSPILAWRRRTGSGDGSFTDCAVEITWAQTVETIAIVDTGAAVDARSRRALVDICLTETATESGCTRTGKCTIAIDVIRTRAAILAWSRCTCGSNGRFTQCAIEIAWAKTVKTVAIVHARTTVCTRKRGALVDIRLTLVTTESRHTGARKRTVAIDMVRTAAAVHAWSRGACGGHRRFTHCPIIITWTLTGESIDMVGTGTSICAWSGSTLVGVRLTYRTRETRRTRTVEAADGGVVRIDIINGQRVTGKSILPRGKPQISGSTEILTFEWVRVGVVEDSCGQQQHSTVRNDRHCGRGDAGRCGALCILE